MLKGIGFLIADKNETPFNLEIVQITPIKSDNAESADDDVDADTYVSKSDNILEHDWYPLNDGVMGGISKGMIKKSRDENIWKYFGQLSLENRGGFSTVRANIDQTMSQGKSGLSVKFKGDGREYKLSLAKSGLFKR